MKKAKTTPPGETVNSLELIAEMSNKLPKVFSEIFEGFYEAAANVRATLCAEMAPEKVDVISEKIMLAFVAALQRVRLQCNETSQATPAEVATWLVIAPAVVIAAMRPENQPQGRPCLRN